MSQLTTTLRTADFTGLSDAAAAAALNALPPVTARVIPLATLAPYLRKFGLMATLKAVAANPQTDQATRAGLSEFLDHLADVRQQNLDTVDPVIATTVAAILGGLRSASLISAEQVAAVYAMGGGPAIPRGLTAEDVAAARAEIASEDRAAERRAAFDVLDNAWGVQVYGVGRAENVRRLEAGESLLTIDELLAFVASGREA